MLQKPRNDRKTGDRRVDLRWVFIGAAAAALVGLVVIFAVVLPDRGASDAAQDGSDLGDPAEVTSPYDFTELPATQGPADVEKVAARPLRLF